MRLGFFEDFHLSAHVQYHTQRMYKRGSNSARNKNIEGSEFSGTTGNSEFHKILENLIINTEKLMAQQGRNIKFSEQVFSFLLKKVEENGNNARSIEKIYRQFLEVPLAKFILKEKGEEIICEIIEEKARFSVLERNIQCKI